MAPENKTTDQLITKTLEHNRFSWCHGVTDYIVWEVLLKNQVVIEQYIYQFDSEIREVD